MTDIVTYFIETANVLINYGQIYYYFNFYVFHTNLFIKYTGILVIQYEVCI